MFKETKISTKYILIVIIFAMIIGGGILRLVKVQGDLTTQLFEGEKPTKTKEKNTNWLESQDELKKRIVSKFKEEIPKEWGETVTGVKTRLDTNQKVIALTFDACGGSKGNGYDSELINFLENNKIPATLFISGRWIDANLDNFQKLKNNSLFEIENHGKEHKPCSVNGKSIYGIEGTNNISEIIDEIEQNARKIEILTGEKPKYYRSGTAYYDEVCVKIAEYLGYKVVNFNILGDAGATYSKNQVRDALVKSKPGSIVIMHMNHPAGKTTEGLMEAIPILKNKGYEFVKLLDYNLK